MKDSKFGIYGGTYIPEILMEPVRELTTAFNNALKDQEFLNTLKSYYRDYINRPSPLYFAKNISKDLQTKIYLKREDLNQTGSHKINNVIGQILLCQKMGKKRVIAETGAGQHGVATATICALFKIPCTVYMGEIDIQKQYLNVMKMEMLGAQVISVTSGTRTLKDAVSAALKDWAASYEETFYCLGSVVGPHPYPKMVREFQRIIGQEIKAQLLDLSGRLPTRIYACVGGGSNAMGSFYDFLNEDTLLYGAEAGGQGLHTNMHAATMSKGVKGVFQGMKSYFLQDEDGQIEEVHSISSGLDYPGVGPEHANLKDQKRVTYEAVTDQEAIDALIYLNKEEGILPAIESAHALALVLKHQEEFKKEDIIIVTISGRGDKDLSTLYELKEQKWKIK